MSKDLFQEIKEQLSQHESTPPVGAWDAISEALPTAKKTKNFRWLQKGKIAASLALFFTVGYVSNEVMRSSDQSNESIPVSFKNTKPNKRVNSLQKTEENSSKKEATIATKNKNSSLEKSTITNERIRPYAPVKLDIKPLSLSKNKTFIQSSTEQLNADDTSLEYIAKLEAKNKEKEDWQDNFFTTETAENKRFYVSTYVMPSLFERANENHSTSQNFTTNYGAKVGIRISDRVHLRSGIGRINLPEQRSNALEVNATSTLARTEEKIDLPHAPKGIVSTAEPTESRALQANPSLLNSEKTNIAYYEFPLEIEYRLVDTKNFGIHLSSGLSTLVLTSKEENPTEKSSTLALTTTGNQDLHSVNFSGNAGVKFNFKLTENLHLDIEPQVKYLLRDVSIDEPKSHPYILGIQSGLSLSF